MEKLVVSTSPHLHSGASTQRIMLDVLIALAPATVASVVLFGLKALVMIIFSVGTAVLSEYLFNLIVKKRQTISDFSACVTGLLLALSLPATTPIWQIVVGAVFAIVVVKCLFGGLGCNFANPAVTARVMMLIAFKEAGGGVVPSPDKWASFDLVTGATPLSVIGKEGATVPSLFDMLLGLRGGAIGEGCIIALLLGFAYLVARRVIKWYVPVTYAGLTFLLSFAFSGNITVATYHLLGGGLILAAVFMITDYVTTPINSLGKVVFAAGCALITVLIRFFGTLPEGVSYAILLMNILSPYIEKLCARKPLGAGGKSK